MFGDDISILYVYLRFDSRYSASVGPHSVKKTQVKGIVAVTKVGRTALSAALITHILVAMNTVKTEPCLN